APCWGLCSPVITLKHVVLPAPFGPISPVIRPDSATKLAWSTAVTPPNWTTTSSTSSSDMRAHLLQRDLGVLIDRQAVAGERRQAVEELEVRGTDRPAEPREQRAGEASHAGGQPEERHPEPAHVEAERPAGRRAVAHRDQHPAEDAAAQHEQQHGHQHEERR